MICHNLVLKFEISCWPPNADESIIETKTRTRVHFTNVRMILCCQPTPLGNIPWKRIVDNAASVKCDGQNGNPQ